LQPGAFSKLVEKLKTNAEKNWKRKNKRKKSVEN
jgi:hypothetical protein